MTTLSQPLPSDIARFCREQGIEEQLDRALALVNDHFPDARGVYAELMYDPDAPWDTWVSLTVELSGALSDILPRDEQFVHRWVAEIPWPAADQIVVDLDIV